MAIFSVEIADEDVGRVIESLCVNYGWQASISDPSDPMGTIDNPETKPIFANRMVRQFLGEHVKKYEIDKATKAVTDSLNINPIISDPQL